MERVSASGGRPTKLTVYDDCDLWEDRMKVYLTKVLAQTPSWVGSPPTRGGVCRELPTTPSSPGPASLSKRALHQARGQDLGEMRHQFLRDLPGSIKVALDITRREGAIHTACPMVQESSTSAFGCRQAPAAIQGTSVDVFGMGQ
ncbi:unnamed protein product [Schistocephalus solidus]|uniref:Uncharacterized protein n=1 Tax=Schistocephalus solidus TaxID=70667 RepID=A0A183TQR2_SCHSO|nr:unnamed protein product [Schistocephalus solidus]